MHERKKNPIYYKFESTTGLLANKNIMFLIRFDVELFSAKAPVIGRMNSSFVYFVELLAINDIFLTNNDRRACWRQFRWCCSSDTFGHAVHPTNRPAFCLLLSHARTHTADNTSNRAILFMFINRS